MDAIVGFGGALIGAAAVIVSQLIIHRKNMQLTAAEKRLQAQQEAFALWWRLATSLNDLPARKAASGECERFWNHHCLYLGRKSRKMFRDTLIDVVMFDFDHADYPERKRLFADVEKVFRAIMDDAALPELTESFIDVQKLLGREEKKA